MGLKSGIVGLPNVGKSTLFNAITRTQVAVASNYPFCTIEPNIGIVLVPDERLEKLAKIAGSEKIIQSTIEIVDIAGLVKNASKGEGLGNQFLGNIREVDAILHVVRCFDDSNIIHVNNKVDPIDDADVIESELMIADIESLAKIKENLIKKKKDKNFQEKADFIDKIIPNLEKGIMINQIKNEFSEEERSYLKEFSLLTEKKMIYIANLDDSSIANPASNEYFKKLEERANQKGIKIVPICSKIEEEISMMSDAERSEMLESFGIKHSGIENIARATYDLLDLISFFTVGPKETHSWPLKKGNLSPQAAGVIHTDFEKGFIKAEVVSYHDYISNNGEAGAKTAGKLRLEGKEYLMKDGDVVHFKFNV